LRLVKLIDFSAWFVIVGNAVSVRKGNCLSLQKDIITLSNSWQQVDFSSVTRLDFHVLMFQK
jgi:hypothetical protein